MIAGVPFFDSLSYPFLIFAGYTTAEYLLKKFDFHGKLLATILLGSFLTMLLDVIIDPVAKLGGQWFLGEIYYYAHPGWYFGVPISNFAGWFVVPLAVILFNFFAWKICGFRITNHESRITILYPLFYISIALFNIAVTFWIGALMLGAASTSIITVIIILLIVFSGLKTGVRSPWKNKTGTCPPAS